ncbi:hypothetical protein ALQ15_200042 [Pseudomonas syringae pv. actinidiae]|uniref:Uncharacterized protein n=1 Tax=Pseudomonas syringae pv. actinidiae TaxID=103796 RepID=A0A7Z6XZN1_PSESF|nr:hypothetical protein ALQ15_200042 [Pseudomonas syringae pv. actinidiae]
MTSRTVIELRPTHFEASPRYLYSESASRAVKASALVQCDLKIVAITSAPLAVRSATTRDCFQVFYEIVNSCYQRQIKPISDGTAPNDIHRCFK